MPNPFEQQPGALPDPSTEQEKLLSEPPNPAAGADFGSADAAQIEALKPFNAQDREELAKLLDEERGYKAFSATGDLLQDTKAFLKIRALSTQAAQNDFGFLMNGTSEETPEEVLRSWRVLLTQMRNEGPRSERLAFQVFEHQHVVPLAIATIDKILRAAGKPLSEE